MRRTNDNGVIVLMADAGKVLTDGDNHGRIIYLAKGADESAWHEITEAEYEEIMNSEQAEEADYADALERFGVK